MKLSKKGQENIDLLIQVTAMAGLTVLLDWPLSRETTPLIRSHFHSNRDSLIRGELL